METTGLSLQSALLCTFWIPRSRGLVAALMRLKFQLESNLKEKKFNCTDVLVKCCTFLIFILQINHFSTPKEKMLQMLHKWHCNSAIQRKEEVSKQVDMWVLCLPLLSRYIQVLQFLYYRFNTVRDSLYTKDGTNELYFCTITVELS